MRRNSNCCLKIYAEKIGRIIIFFASLSIAVISFKYYFFPPATNTYSDNSIQKYGGDLQKYGTIICAYYDDTLYPQAHCYLDEKNELITYLDLNFENLTSQSIDVRNIKINIKDYQNAVPFRFQINRPIGGDGEIKDHIYFGELISNREENYLSYCGDENM